MAGVPGGEQMSLADELVHIHNLAAKDPDLVAFQVSQSDPLTWNLISLIIARHARGLGKGSAIVAEICARADCHGLRVLLTPGLRDSYHGTTSRTRLVKFYKRFGFVENKGRRKDFTTMAGMYRSAHITPPQAVQAQAQV